jgi:hypothetical protein
MLASEKIYADCGPPILTPMASNPAITEQGLANVFHLTNRDDHKGPALALWLSISMGKQEGGCRGRRRHALRQGRRRPVLERVHGGRSAVLKRWTAKAVAMKAETTRRLLLPQPRP